MTNTLTEAVLQDKYTEILDFYQRVMARKEIQAAPEVGNLEFIRDQVQELADGEVLTSLRVFALVNAVRHLESGIHAQELGYPGMSDEERQAADTTIRNAGEVLSPYAAQQGAVVQAVVDEMKEGQVPRGPQEVASVLALVLRGIPVRGKILVPPLASAPSSQA